MKRFSSISTILSRTIFHKTLTNRSSNIQKNVIRCYCDRSDPTSSKHPGPLIFYKNLVEQGKLQHDPYQEKVAVELQDLFQRLERYQKDMEEYHVKLADWEKNREDKRRKLLMEEAESRQQGGVWTAANKQRNNLVEKWIIRKRNENVESGVGKWVSYLNREKRLDSLIGHRPVAPQAPKGLYLYGNVGSGKTMLMDMFYSATEGIVPHRRRFHFHELLFGSKLHLCRKKGSKN